MADSLKFGPEWLRTLNQSLAASAAASTACTPPSSEGGTGGGHGTATVAGATVPRPALTLARHRYGREEMLALFDPGLPPPPTPPAALAVLFVERAQPPLALVQMSDEETRVWNRGVNSDAVLRMSKSAGGGGPAGPLPSGPGSTGGRGGGISSTGGPGGLRGQSRSVVIPGRGSNSGPGSGMMSSSAPFYRYDDSNTGGDGGGESIRGGGLGSLRPGRPFVRMQSSERSWSDRNGTDHEWGGGSGPGGSALGTSPRKDFGRGFESWRRQGRNTVNTEQDDDPPAPGGWRNSANKWSGRTTGSNWRSDIEPNKDTGGWSVSRSSNSWGDDHAPSRGPHPHVHRPWDPPSHAHSHPVAHNADNDSVSGPLPEWATETPSESRGSFDSSGAFHGGTPLSDDEDGGGNHSSGRGHRHLAEAGKRPTSPLRQHDTAPPGVTSSILQNSVGEIAERQHRQPQEATKCAPADSDPPRSVPSRSTDQPGGGKDAEPRRAPTEKLSPTPTSTASTVDREKESSTSRPDEEMDRMREVADDLVAKLMEDEDHRTGAPPPTSVASATDKWYYRDPQGDVQGPFSSSEMLDWFRSGYFNLTLLVRRACDERYSSLGDIIKLWGRLPFVPGGPLVPPIKADALPPVSSVSVPPLVPAPPPPTSDILSESHSHNLLMQQYQYQYSMLQRQLLLGQQAAVHAAAQAAIGELSQSDRWATLSPIEQRRLVTERLALQQMLGVPPLVPPVSVPPPSIVDLFSVAAAQQQPGPQPTQQPPPPPTQPPHSQQAVSATNPVAQLISQMQMGAVAAAVAPKDHQPATSLPLVDPLQQLIQQMSGGLPTVSSAPTGPPPSSQPLVGVGLDSDGPGRTLLQTLNAGKPPAMPPPRLPPVQVDSVWGGSVPAGYSLGVGAATPWLNATVSTPTPPVSSTPSVPPGQLPTLPLSLWDLAQQQGKDIKTEHQVIEEQLRAEEERRLEEHRKREETEEVLRKQKEQQEKEEEVKRQEEEERRKKRRQEEEEEKKKKKQQEEEERRKKKQQEDEEKRRKKQQEEEEKKKKKQQEEEEKRRKKEEERRLREQEEEEKRRKKEEEEAERQQREEEERERKKKQQEAKKIEEAMKKEKEKAAQKREEEKKRKEAEKEKKRKAEEARKKEEEEKKKQEEEERARQRRQEQQREALRRLQEQQEKARQAAALRPAPWTATPAAPAAATVQQPLTEIQRQERERERQLQLQQQQQQQQQQLLQQQQQQQLQLNASIAAQNSASAQSSNGSSGIGGLQLRWAEVKPPTLATKSLTEIQQEEQENLAKQQQLERERLQQQQQQQATVAPAIATASIWGSASQSLSWAASVSASPSPWGNAGVNANSTSSGFWEDATKASLAVPVSKSRSATNHNNNIINNNSTSGNNKNSSGGTNSTQPWKALPSNTKTRSKKEEAVVMKLFEPPRPDEFTQWCTEALGSLTHSIDVPTFVAFLRDIESAYEVKDYVRVYLGEGRDAQEFSRQFLERRSRLQQQKAARDRTPEDDLSTPAPAITPSQDFHEVKGKGKKAKKSRMYKVDSRILGFSVTAAQDRLNVGERDFGDGM